MSNPATKADLENVVTLLQDHFQRSDQQVEGINNRLDRINDTLVGVQAQMAGMTKWSDRFDREHTAILQTQAAQQRAIDSLVARVAKLEERKAS